MNLYIHGYKLVMTCFACPEQYDVFDPEGNQVGYLRLRHGYFAVHFPECGGDVVFYSYAEGDGLFEDHERYDFLVKAVEAIQKAILNKKILSIDYS